MLTVSIILNFVLILGLVYMVFVHTGIIEDKDKNFLPDSIEEKVKKMKSDLAEMKERLSDELEDVADAVKEVGDQIEDIPGAISTKRKGRKKNVS